MARKLSVWLEGSDCRVSATLNDDGERELCDRLWNELEQPLRVIPDHTLSTGDFFMSRGRPSAHPVATGSQARPIARNPILLSRLKPGTVMYGGASYLSFAYGPDITEPLVASGGIAAHVCEADLPAFRKLGRLVWEAQYRTHELRVIEVGRIGDN